MAHSKMLLFIPEDVETKYRKWYVDTCDVTTVKKYLAYQQEQHMGEDEMPVTATDIHLDVPHKKEHKTAKWPGSMSKWKLTQQNCESTLSPTRNHLIIFRIEQALKREKFNEQKSINNWKLELLNQPCRIGQPRWCSSRKKMESSVSLLILGNATPLR